MIDDIHKKALGKGTQRDIGMQLIKSIGILVQIIKNTTPASVTAQLSYRHLILGMSIVTFER